MHPIERLRAVAGASWAPVELLVAEAAEALADLAGDEPAALVPACRQLLGRHPWAAPLWWLASHVLVAGDPADEALRCAGIFDDDPTPSEVDVLLAGRRAVRRGAVGDVAGAEVVVIAVEAIGSKAVIEPARLPLWRAAVDLGVPIWLEVGVGRLVPDGLWAAMGSVADAGHVRPPAMVSPDEAAQLIGPAGGAAPSDRAAVAARTPGWFCPEPVVLLGLRGPPHAGR